MFLQTFLQSVFNDGLQKEKVFDLPTLFSKALSDSVA